MKTNKESYAKYIPVYGILTLLYALDVKERQQDFEECSKIRDAIAMFNKKYEMDLPTYLNGEAIEYVITSLNIVGGSSNIAMENYKYYAVMMLSDIQKEFTDRLNYEMAI